MTNINVFVLPSDEGKIVSELKTIFTKKPASIKSRTPRNGMINQGKQIATWKYLPDAQRDHIDRYLTKHIDVHFSFLLSGMDEAFQTVHVDLVTAYLRHLNYQKKKKKTRTGQAVHCWNHATTHPNPH
jgi:hypothetical protein